MRLSLVILVSAALSGLVIKFNRPIGHFLDRWGRWHPFEGGFEINGIPVLLYTNVATVSPFSGTVESKTFEKASITNQNERPSSPQIAWMSIRVKKADGTRVAIVWEDPDSNMIALANSLRDGASYEFPLVINKWSKNRQ